MAMPRLDNDALQVLKYMNAESRTRKDVLRGGDVMKTLGLTSQRLVEVLNQLSDQDLVRVHGPRDAENIDSAVLFVDPANRDFVRSL